MKKAIVSILITAIVSNAVFAQLWTKGALEQSDWNLSLKKMKVGDTLEKEYYPCFGGKYDAVLASSWLPAEGNPPRTLMANEKDENGDSWDESEIDWANQNRYDSWTEMYGPGKCFDGKTDTAWCEGKSDDGIGEVVIAWVDVKRPVRIWTTIMPIIMKIWVFRSALLTPVAMSTRRLQIHTKDRDAAMRTPPMRTVTKSLPSTGLAMRQSPFMQVLKSFIVSGAIKLFGNYSGFNPLGGKGGCIGCCLLLANLVLVSKKFGKVLDSEILSLDAFPKVGGCGVQGHHLVEVDLGYSFPNHNVLPDKGSKDKTFDNPHNITLL